ncbi:MAG: diadenylate cyclase CdaA [Bdellovibrionales bacterium]|nr:diadenylate cyclase CdaA [Bdellovibrionales bacterium]
MLENFLNNIATIKAHFRIQDLVDLFLVWIIIYRVLLLIRQTRAIQMLAGLGLLAIAYVASIWLELLTLGWLLEKFFSNLFVIVVILFQSEIRRALAHFGRNPFFTGISAFEETQVIEEIAKGSAVLAQRGIGALIVIEREMGLEDFVELGTPLEAKVSTELLFSIFSPASPLHDGALIIRGGRAHSAGCFLPLTKNPMVDRNLGTRHRAAIGLSEETDAVVLVISEENRQVSIVEQGRMIPDLDHKAIRSHLYKFFNLEADFQDPASERSGVDG